MDNVVILSAVRTAIGAFGGTLKNVPAWELGKSVIEESVSRAGIGKEEIDEVLFGCVLQGGLGQNIARQCSIRAGIPDSVPAMTINKVCGSGLRTISLGAQTIKAGDNRVVIAGGTENMSKSGYYLEGARFGYRMGDKNLVDSMIKDGLWDAINDYHMGMTAENIVDRYNISRQEQDAFATASHRKAEAACTQGRFEDEIMPIEIVGKRGEVTSFLNDEHIRYGIDEEKLEGLRAAFKTGGSVTAGNASGINDGAAALVLSSESYAAKKDIKPMARVIGYADTGLDPSVMGLGPVKAIKKALEKSELTIEDVGLFEINEAFASQSIAVIRELGLDKDLVNVNGGAIALGHPIGASGARIVVTLLHEMQKRHVKYGVAALCIGGGMGTAIVVENLFTRNPGEKKEEEEHVQ